MTLTFILFAVSMFSFLFLICDSLMWPFKILFVTGWCDIFNFLFVTHLWRFFVALQIWQSLWHHGCSGSRGMPYLRHRIGLPEGHCKARGRLWRSDDKIQLNKVQNDNKLDRFKKWIIRWRDSFYPYEFSLNIFLLFSLLI